MALAPFLRLSLVRLIAALGMGCTVLAIAFGNCAPAPKRKGPPVNDPLEQQIYKLYKRSQGPAPESEWNVDRLWYRVEDDPPTYLPRGYGRARSRSPNAGTWITDKRDGKRLFVPKGGANGLPEAVLRAEARNATGGGPGPT